MNDTRRKLRILVLTSTFPRWNNDTEPRFVLDLCRHLQKYAELRVIAPLTKDAAPDEVIEGVRVLRFKYYFSKWQAVAYEGGITSRLRHNPLRILQLPLFMISMWWLSLRILLKWKPDIIHAHWIIPQGLVACLLPGRKIPLLCTSHGGDLHSLQNGFFHALKSWTVKNCQAISVVSQSMVRLVEGLSQQTHVEVIPMGTDLTVMFKPPEGSLQRDKNHLLFVGRLVEKKGVRYLLEAFAKMQRSNSALRLTIIGDGPLEVDVRRLANTLGLESSIKFTGGLPQKELVNYYQKATLAVFPFIVAKDGDQEGFGLVIVEAMGCGCPVVASDLPAIRQSIEPYESGFLVPPENSLALANMIENCLKNESLRSNIAINAMKNVREQYDWPIIAAKYNTLIESAIRRWSN